MIKFKNLTPHEVTIVAENGDKMVLPKAPTGAEARIDVIIEELKPINGFKLICEHGTRISNLPDPEDDVVFIVSARVMLAARRKDVVSPGELIRDSNGIVVGANGLTTFPQ